MSGVFSRLINLAGAFVYNQLPLSKGGTNKNMTAVTGGLVYSDADSMEVTSAGTAQNWVLSGGAAAPTMSNTTTTAKTIDGSADAVQLQVEGHSTQTSDIVNVRKSDGSTSVLQVTNVNGTKIRGTTTNDDAAAGFVGEFKEVSLALASKNQLNGAGTAENLSGGTLALTAGDWEISGCFAFDFDSTTRVTEIHGGISATTGTMPANSTLAQPNVSTGEYSLQMNFASGLNITPNGELFIPINTYRVSLSGSTTLYPVVSAVFTVANGYAYGFVQARRVR
jgi:hypothetical protein